MSSISNELRDEYPGVNLFIHSGTQPSFVKSTIAGFSTCGAYKWPLLGKESIALCFWITDDGKHGTGSACQLDSGSVMLGTHYLHNTRITYHTWP